MAVSVPARIYRNRHGGFYFRVVVPKSLRAVAGRSEFRFSLQTQQRQTAIARALVYISGLPILVAHLQTMTDKDESPKQDIFHEWQKMVYENAKLRMRIFGLQDERDDLKWEIAGMVPRIKAHNVVKQAFTLGQLKGKKELEQHLVFPWLPEKTKPFSELLKAYLKSFSARPEGGTRKPPGAKTLEGYEKDIEFFIKVMGDVHIGAIDREFAGEYFKILQKLPANISRKAIYKDKTIPELLALKDPPQSEYNASKKMERPSGMFKWALKEKKRWGIDANPFEGFGQSGENETKRRPFTNDEMRVLFGHPNFSKRKFPETYMYWMIPLAIFTGARLGELAQLDIKDFVVIDGVDCLDINDIEAVEDLDIEGRRKKRVKTKNAKRLVPIHPELLRLGLLRYVETMRTKQQVHFFPELSRTRRDGPAQAPSNWFQRFRALVGITTKQETVFHSFRHGFITNLLDAGVTPYLVAPIVGHEPDLITGRVYWNTKDAAKRKPVVDAFTLPSTTLELIPSIEEVKFDSSQGPKAAKKITKNMVKKPLVNI